MDADHSRDGADDSARRVAAAAVAQWKEIFSVLAPVLGHRGVAALYRRALSLSVRTYPFLKQAQGTSDPQTFERLHAVLAHQSVAEAIAASHGMVTTFQALLTSLIGPLLTDRLLGNTLQAAYNAPSRENDAE